MTKERSLEPNQIRLGDLLIQEKLITEAQLTKAIRVQKQLNNTVRLGEILVELDYIVYEKLQKVVDRNKKRLKIGDLLVEKNLLSPDQLEHALDLAKFPESKGKKIGEILIENKYISEFTLISAIAEQNDIPIIEINHSFVDYSLMNNEMLPTLMEKLFLPLSHTGSDFTVVFNDPFDKELLKSAKSFFNKDFSVAIATKKTIKSALDYYKTYLSEKQESEKRIVEFVNSLLQDAVAEGVSDIHFEPMRDKLRIRFRKDGSLMNKTDIPKDYENIVIARIKIMAKMDISEKRRHQDGKFTFIAHNKDEVDVRVSSFVTVYGESCALRILNKRKGIVPIYDLGFSKSSLQYLIDESLLLPSGVVMITGPTGAGKTTTLYSAIAFCDSPKVKILTIEDPVEYVIDGIAQCSINTKIGMSFENTMPTVVRQDPDIIVLGEIRDKLSAQTAIQAALTGHKVFTTFHTEDAIGGLLRLIDMDIETFLISSTVVSIIAQRLVKKVCEHCKTKYTPTRWELKQVGISGADAREIDFCKGVGCSHCNFTGYDGRVGIYEILLLNELIRDGILQKKTGAQIRQIVYETTNMVSMQEDAIYKIAKGITTIEEVLRLVPRLYKVRPLREIFKLAGDDDYQ